MGWLKKLTGKSDDRQKWLESHPGKRPLSAAPQESPDQVARVRAKMEQELESQRDNRASQ